MEFNSQSAIAFVRLLAPLVSFCATALGITFDADVFANALLGVITIILFIWSWWKNNNVTYASQEAQKVLNEIKDIQVEDREDEE